MRWWLLIVAFCCVLPQCLSPQAANWEQVSITVKQLSRQGKWADALALAQQAVRLAAAFGAESSQMASSLTDLASIEEAQGRSAEAIQAYTRAFQIYYKTAGPEDLQTARVGVRAGTLMIESANLREGCPTVKRGEEILEKKLGPDDREIAGALLEVGNCLHYDRKNDEAEAVFRRALAIDEKVLGPSHRALAGPLSCLASLDHDQGKFAEADPFYRRALAIMEKTLGPGNSDTSEIALGAAINYYGWGKPELAEPLYDRRMQVFARELAAGSSYMSERDRLALLQSASGIYPLYFSFVYANASRPGLAGKMYDLLVNERGLAAGSSAELRAKVLASADRQTLALFDQLRAKKTQVATLVTSTYGNINDRRKNVTQLYEEINGIEERLAQRGAAISQGRPTPAPNWRDVQRALQPGEAAVEYVRFHFHDGRTFTNTWNYAALVLTRENEPKLIPLGDAIADEKTVIDLFARQSGSTRGFSKDIAPIAAVSPDCYNAFWKPIEGAIGESKRVYVAGDAILNQFPIGLFVDGSGQMLMERYDLRFVNSTKALLQPQARPTANTAVLVGNPAFDLGLSAGAPNGSLASLPATQKEVELISKALQSAGWQVQTLTGSGALKEAVLAQHGPRVLHLATHGFFVSTTRLQQLNQGRKGGGLDEMLQSGLFFAGANRTLSGAPPVAGSENGILTSYEAAQLDLRGSELVVLSACETARGQQGDNGEGVFGLRRALEEAGAQAVLMSSWSVPDRETQELMTLFYKKWLTGADKHEALRQAQLEERAAVRDRYGKDMPYYWGAFVLVGR